MTFDPYHKWLGIAPKDQPPNHYRLLAIEVFESDPEVIDAAANRQMAYLQQRATGEHAALSQKLLNEVAAARVCLLNPKKKAEYDSDLKAKLAGEQQEAEKSNPDLNETLGESAEAERLPSVPPAPLARAFRFPKPQLWHYVVGIGVAGLLLIGIWAFLVLGEDSKEQAAAIQPKQSAVPEQGGVAVASPPKSPSPWDSRPPLPVPATTPPESPSSRMNTEPPKSDSATKSPQAKPNEDAPAIYNVTVDPPSAELRAEPDKVIITGVGRERQIRIEKPRQAGYLHLTASCDGYERDDKWFVPSPGKTEDVSMSLEKVTTTENRPHGGNTGNGKNQSGANYAHRQCGFYRCE